MKYLVAGILLLTACNHGNDYLMGEEQPDLVTVPVVDMSTLPDLTPAGPSCGQIATCAIGCAQDPTCLTGCFMGADPQTLITLGTLLVCAGTNCLAGTGGGDGGGGGLGGILGGLGNIDQGQLFMCLFQSCQQQLTMCGGLFGGL